MHFHNSNFKHKMKTLKIPKKLVYEIAVVKNFYVHGIVTVNLSKKKKKNEKKTYKPNNSNLNRD